MRRTVPLSLAIVVAIALLAAASPQAAEQGEMVMAELVGDETCAACHEDYSLGPDNVHARIESFEVRGHTVGCEGCHGPGSLHVDEADPEKIRRFAAGGIGDTACLECHRGRGLPQWHASTHAIEGVGCTDCHEVHTGASPEASCQSCHADSVAQFQLPSHHPLPEGKMSCASCHNVHSAREAMLKTSQRANDLCYTCHQAVEGPWVFEHPPVLEDCSNCHVPHGAVANNLLVANEPTLCLQCHEFHFHSGYRGSDELEVEIGGIPRENPFREQGFNIAYTTKCTQCHSQIHGSDLPSQTTPSMGRGLTQ